MSSESPFTLDSPNQIIKLVDINNQINSININIAYILLILFICILIVMYMFLKDNFYYNKVKYKETCDDKPWD
jgi:hypothetical protein